MNTTTTIVKAFDTDFTTPLLFLVLNTNEETEFVACSDFYLNMILASLELDEPYVLEVETADIISKNLTEEGIKNCYPESKEFCQIELLNLDMDGLMNLESY